MKMILSCCTIFLAAAACSSSPEVRYYTLSPHPGSNPAVSTPRARYAIDSVAIPDLLDRPQIVIHDNANLVDVLDYDRWASPLSDQIRRVLAADLAARVGADAIVDPGLPATSSARRITLSIRTFDPGRDYDSVIEASWTISGTGASPIPADTPIHRARHVARSTAPKVPAIVATMSDLLSAIADDLAQTLTMGSS
jgi:uncharacterized protein